MAPNTEFIIIWGMHRSGTSMFARCLRVFGADLGTNLFSADRGNTKGYFEDRTLMRLNNAMLADLGLSWDSLVPIESSHVQFLEGKGYGDVALEFLRTKAENQTCIGLKDPRMTRLAPFWIKIFSLANIKPKCILAIRHPLSVAHSLQKRARSWKIPGFTANLEYGCYLWLGYTLAALIYTEHLPRALVQYENFLASPEEIILALAKKLNLKADPKELQIFLSEFVDETMDHNILADNEPIMPERVKNLYTLLQDAKGLTCPAPEIVGEMWPNQPEEIFLTTMLAKAGINLEVTTAKLQELHEKIKRTSDNLAPSSKCSNKEK